jgi:iron complex outermembrane recepter protein
VIGYRDTNESAIQEFDGVRDAIFWTERPQKLNQFSAELRYQGDIGPAKIVAGGYYWDSDYELKQITRSPVFFPPATGIISTRPDYNQNSKNWAVFGQVDYEVVENLTLTLGGRYTEEKKSACGVQALELVGAGIVNTAAYGACDDSIRNAPYYQAVAVNPLSDPSVSLAGGLTRPTGAAASYTQTGKQKWTNFSPKIGLDYKFETDAVEGMGYVSWSKGFRSGGFNGRSTTAFSLGPYNPETVESWEVGAKTSWLDNRVQFNVTGFFMKYKNKQEDVVFPDPVAVTVTVVQNAASATINGLEAEFKAVVTDGFTVSANLGYLDAKFDEWNDVGFNLALANPTSGFVPIDKSDFKLRRSPKWSFGLTGNYVHEFDSGHKLSLNAGYNYRSSYYIIANTVTFGPENPGLVRGYGLLDLSISYDTDRFRVSVFGKNVTDENYFMHVLDVGTGFGATPGNSAPVALPGLWTFGSINPPATFGVELQVKF